MLINNAVITGSFIVNGVDVTGITGSSAISSSYLALSSSYVITSASYAQSSASLSIRTSNLEATSSTLVSASSSFAAQSASLSTRLTTDESNYTNLSSSFATTSGSISGRVTTIESKYATTGSNTFTNVQYISSTVNAAGFTTSASLYTDGGLRVSKDSFVSGTAYFNNVVVYGTSSIQYLTSSQVNVGANIINLNTQTPAVRFGGMAVADSGSNPGVTGSMLWDSVNNGWIYARESGSTYAGGALISGPRSSVQGSEQGTLSNYVMKGQGGDHITSSQIIDDGTTVMIPGNLQVTGSLVGSSTATFYSSTSAVGTSYLQRASSGASTTLQFRNEAGLNRAKILFGGTNEELGFYAGDGTATNLTIASTGVATFSSTVCACIVTGPTISAGIPTNSRIVANSNTMYGYYDVETNYRWALGRDVWAGGSGGLSFGVGGTTTCYSMIGDPSGYGCTIGFAILVPNGCSGTTYEKMRLTGTGLGIGTCNPTNILHLCKSSGNVSLTLQTGGNYGYFYNDGTNIGLASDIGSTGLKFIVNRSAPDNSMTITSGGNIGVGTTTPGSSWMMVKPYSGGCDPGESLLSVVLGDTATLGSALLTIKNGGNRGSSTNGSGTALFRADFTDATAMIIGKNGFTGIGVCTPKAQLDVACGNAHGIISTWCKQASNGTMYNGFDIYMDEASFAGTLYIQANGGGIGIQATYDILASYDRICAILRNSMNRGQGESLTIPSYAVGGGSKRICIQQNNGAAAVMNISAMLVGTAYGGQYICAQA